MQTPVSLKSAERKVFQLTFADGLWDVLIGCFALQFAIAPLLSRTLGDFWSSAIFLPFWGLVYLAIWLTRKYVVTPRLGMVKFGKPRQGRLRRLGLVMLGANLLMLVLGILAAVIMSNVPDRSSINLLGNIFSSLLGLFLLAGFSLAAYLLDYSRLYLYGLLLFLAPPVGEWLYTSYGAAHHGFPIVFGFTAGVMILAGLMSFLQLLKNTSVVGS
jgi:hypothetical protein